MHTVRRKSPLLAAVAVGYLLLGVSAAAGAEDFFQAARKLQAEYAAGLEKLAAWCQRQGLAEEAKKTRECLGPRDPYKLYLPVLPEKIGLPTPPADAVAEVLEWDRRLAKLRQEQSAALFGLARRAVRRRPSLAYALALAAIRADPDNQSVRRLFGYQKYGDRWRTSYAVRQLRAGKVWHEKFGWIPEKHVRRYEQGERLLGRRWITAAEDAKLHRNIRRGWTVNTEHYTITTNHSIEAGVGLGLKLERLYRLWQQIFIRYYATGADVIALFDAPADGTPSVPATGHSGRRRPPRLQVVYFRDRDDYNRSLLPVEPNIARSIGFYCEQTRKAYFFAGKDSDDRTLYHEATHQLFHQSRRVAPNVGRRANFWIVEGIAMFMESLRREGDYWVLGGLDDERIHAGRYRLLKTRFYVPLAELTTYGMQQVQSDKRIAMLYSQAAGLTAFLVYHDQGRYRDALVAYLSIVYSGRDTPGTLARLTGVSYAELDKQYRQFMLGSIKAKSDR